MGKNKKGGKRMSKKQMVELLENFFSSEPGQTFTLKEIFQDLKLNTHPLKMLAIDTMDNLSYDDYLTKVNDSSYKLNQNGQVQEGTFVRKANGKNSFIPEKFFCSPFCKSSLKKLFPLFCLPLISL